MSNLISDPSIIKPGRINIIDAPVSGGKTRFALTALPQWAGTPEKVLYLIDTINGDLYIQRNAITKTIGRDAYAFFDYNTKSVWGEQPENGLLPVMTYSGFGSEVRKNGTGFRYNDYEYIICDELQHLVTYQNYDGDKSNLIAAEIALRGLLLNSNTKIVAISATPQKIRDHFGDLCYTVPYDKSDIVQLETFHEIPYSGKAEDILDRIAAEGIPKTGILYTTAIVDMKRFIDYANSIGIRANGFWSANDDAQRKYPFTPEQRALRQAVLEKETIPEELQLLVINAASETCIKIQSENRKVDYIIVHNSDEEIRTQVRGRYHGDLDRFYYHDVEAANQAAIRDFEVPERFLNKRLFKEEREELCALLALRKKHGTEKDIYKWPTLARLLRENGYEVSESKKDKNRNGQRYYVICAGTKIRKP